MRITNPNIQELAPNEIFVFGSNLAGIHGAGAAKLALDKFGAKWGVGEGLTGQCYALPTKDENIELRNLLDIEESVYQFGKLVATRYQDKQFLVTEVGCGLAGCYPEQIAPMFEEFCHLDNISLPLRFWQVLFTPVELRA